MDIRDAKKDFEAGFGYWVEQNNISETVAALAKTPLWEFYQRGHDLAILNASDLQRESQRQLMENMPDNLASLLLDDRLRFTMNVR